MSKTKTERTHPRRQGVVLLVVVVAALHVRTAAAESFNGQASEKQPLHLRLSLGTGSNTPEGLFGARIAFEPLSRLSLDLAFGLGGNGYRATAGAGAYLLKGPVSPFLWAGGGYNWTGYDHDPAFPTATVTGGVVLRSDWGLFVAAEAGYAFLLTDPPEPGPPSGFLSIRIFDDPVPAGPVVGIRVGGTFSL